VTLGSVIWFAFGVVLMYALWRVGITMLRAVTMATPEPPPPGEMRKVNMRFRCDVCGVELKLTMAPDEDPPPPKHCLEDMIIVAPTFE
tara:strand:- start:328 stop:591 length:264 start_codon:yes stop_codon:yes gene_type:complete